MSKPAFVGRFLLIFALLIVVGWATDAPRRYAAALRAPAGALSPVLTGRWIETRTDSSGKSETWFRRGEDEPLKLLLSLEALALGMLPLLSLFGATPRLGWKRLATRAALAVLGLFALDIIVLLLYPTLVRRGAVNDIAGTFLGLLTFVGGPVILWFVLTFDQLRGVWRFPERNEPAPTKGRSGRDATVRAKRVER
jgi:hypothetical protein